MNRLTKIIGVVCLGILAISPAFAMQDNGNGTMVQQVAAGSGPSDPNPSKTNLQRLSKKRESKKILCLLCCLKCCCSLGEED